MTDHRMTLGNRPPFSGYGPRERAPYPWDCHDRYWPTPYEEFFDRIATRQRYKVAPRPWAPGRYRTAMWQPYSGHGRFSGLPDILKGAYYAERYSGVRRCPEDYIKRHGAPGEYEASMDRWRRQRSWRLAA